MFNRPFIPNNKTRILIAILLLQLSALSLFGQVNSSGHPGKSIDSLNRVMDHRKKTIDSLMLEQDLSRARLKNHLLDLHYGNENDSIMVCILGTTLNRQCSPLQPIVKVEAGEKIRMLNDTNPNYYYAEFGKDTGFVSRYYLIRQSKYTAIYKNEWRTMRYQALLQEHRKVHLMKKHGKTNGQNYLQGKIWIGMPYEVLLGSWGLPDLVKTVLDSEAGAFICQYGAIKFYFEDNELVLWEIMKQPKRMKP